jgi:[ribosomal protein S5]-alanine N-acetyltransferase
VIRTSTQTATVAATIPVVAPSVVTTTDWRAALPVLEAAGLSLRELKLSDAPTLLEMLSTEEVARFISPPPTTVEGFERFIAWTHRERAAGRYVCFGIVPDGFEHAVGIIQVRTLGAGFDIAEWGFALGSSFWGTGVFQTAAREVLAFTFDTVGTHRLEARSSVDNSRGNGALQKLGATREGLLRKSFLRNGVYHDQVIWSICSEDWREWQCAPAVRAH